MNEDILVAFGVFVHIVTLPFYNISVTIGVLVIYQIVREILKSVT